MFFFPLEGGAELRPLELRHTEALYAAVIANRERLRPWMPWMKDDLAIAETRSYIEQTLARTARDEGFDAMIFIDGQIAGAVGFHDVSRLHRRAAMGYWLAGPFEGRGIMTRAVRAMCDHGFGPMGLNRIEIGADVANTRSRALPPRLGFELESIRRQTMCVHGEFKDDAVYVMLASRWQKP